MAEYINREAAYEDFEKCNGENPKWTPSRVKTLIARQKAADVAPVRHGRWLTHSDRPDSLICSVCECGFDMWKHDPHNFCPNCGAKMDGGDENGR